MGVKVDFVKLNIKSSYRKARSNGYIFTVYVKDCELCNKEFETDKSKKKYCSIGCSKGFKLRKNERFFREKITRIRSNAKKRGINFTLKWQDLSDVYDKQKGLCFYSAQEMKLSYSTKTHKVCPPDQLSVDRLDSNKGYEKENIVLCCFNINNFKGESSIMDFKALLRNILRSPVTVALKTTHPNAVIPKYSKPGDAGMDLTCVSKEENDLYIEYDTGISIELPENYVGLVYPRSSLSNYHLILSNHVGVVDSGYRGSIKFRFKKTSDKPDAKYYQIGDRIGQLIVMHQPLVLIDVVDELGDSSRGNLGFGSSGK